MKRLTILFAVLAVFLWVGSAFAYTLSDLGTEITVADGQVNSNWGGGSQALGIAGEDNETEGSPNTYTYQSWDLEGMFWSKDTNSLFIIGGFDYVNGVEGYAIGDVFIGDQYVLNFDRNGENLGSTGSFNVISGYSSTVSPTDVPSSAPYQYNDGVTDNGNIIGAGSYNARALTTDEWSPMDLFSPWRETANGEWVNDIHYILEISSPDIASLIGEGQLIHLTLECGNDTIEGRAPVPEPATMLLFGVGLCGLAFVGRKKLIRQG